MRRRSPEAVPAVLAALLALAGCGEGPATPAPPAAEPATETPAARESLGLMTSLPLYWPLGAGIAEIAGGRVEVPWQRAAIEGRYRIVPLDTLSPVPAVSPGAPDADPLAGLTRLAVIQPRGLSPGDNVALDDWVRSGGQLLLVLDPMLSGEYDLPIGDPRRPVDTALIPPVVERWGLAVGYDEGQSARPVDSVLLGTYLPLILRGEVAIADPAAGDCTREAHGAAARCRVGEGQVILIADAAIFEHRSFAGENGIHLRNLLAAVFP